MTIDNAFDILKSHLQDELEHAQDSGAEAMMDGKLDRARDMLDRAQTLSDALKELDKLEEKVSALVLDAPPPQQLSPSGRLERGVRTPEVVFRRPILEALVGMGGSGTVDDVLSAVYERIKDQLNEHDHALLDSGAMVRWRNTAQWARNSLRAEGFIRNDSMRGLWEISDAGRAWLKRQ